MVEQKLEVNPDQPQPASNLRSSLISNKILLLFLLVIVIGIYIGLVIGKKGSYSTRSETQITPTLRPTKIPMPTPTVRPTDPIVNGKKQYRAENFGMTFEYPVDWEIKQDNEYIDQTDIRAEAYVGVGNIFVHKNRFDGAGGFGAVIYTEKIIIDGISTELEVRNYCWEEVMNIYEPKCDKVYGFAFIRFEHKGNLWEITGPDIQVKEEIQDKLKIFKEVLSTIKFAE